MRLILAAVGRLKAGAERELISRYRERIAPLGRKHGLGPLSVLEIGESRQSSATARRSEEARALLQKLPKRCLAVALDESGRGMTSRDFARLLARRRDDGAPALSFLIGGPDGHGGEIGSEGLPTLSLGPMTLPHGLVRVIMAEQIYRALTILDGHPYHRES